MKAEFKNEVQTTMRNQSNELKNDIKNMMSSFFQMNSPSGSGSHPSNIVANPRGDLKAITTRSGVSYDGPTIPTTSSPLLKEVEREPEAKKDKVQTINLGSTTHVQPLVAQLPILEPDVAPNPNPKPLIPYPLRLNEQKLREKASNQMLNLLSNKEKLFELANTLLNENCSAVLLKKLPEKLRDPGKFLIPCDFPKLDECLALADLGASINLMPLFVWKKLSLPELTHTRMTLELANRSVTYPVGVAKDVIVKVQKFHFPADFIVVDYDVDPHVPLILGRPFLRTARALVDVFGEELILRDGDEKLIFHADNTSKHPQNPANESINTINFIDITCEDHFSEVLKFKKSNHPSSGSTTPLSDSLPSLAPFETSDSLLEEFADELSLSLTESLPKSDIEIIDPILKRFTNEPAHVYSFLPGDDDDDNNDLFTTSLLVLPVVEPKDYFIMRDEDLRSIPEKESDELIKSSVEDLVPIPRESKDTFDSDKECDLPNFVTFFNPLFDPNDDFTSSDDESLPKEDVPEENFKIYSTPLFEFNDEYIPSGINPFFNEVLEDIKNMDSYLSNLDESALLVTPLFDANEDECFNPGGDIDEIDADVSTDFKDDYYNSEGDTIYLKSLFINDTIPNLPPKVFFDHDPKSLNNEPDNDDLKSMIKVFDPGIHEKIISPTYVRLPFEDRHYLSLKFVIKIFLPFLIYLVNSLLLLSFGSEDAIFNPGISAYSFYSLELVAYGNSMMIFLFFCFCLKNKGIRGESS
ncbi:reverse transcriptase domain-containing protein [Tanacetum coccineum]